MEKLHDAALDKLLREMPTDAERVRLLVNHCNAMAERTKKANEGYQDAFRFLIALALEHPDHTLRVSNATMDLLGWAAEYKLILRRFKDERTQQECLFAAWKDTREPKCPDG